MLIVSIIGEDLAALSLAASMALCRGTENTTRDDTKSNLWLTRTLTGRLYLFLLCGSETEVVEDLRLQRAEGLQQGWDQAGGVRL